MTMDLGEFLLHGCRKIDFNKEAWVPLRAHSGQRTGDFGSEGYVSDLFGAGSVAVPLNDIEAASKSLSWYNNGLAHDHRGYFQDGVYYPADVYEGDGFTGVNLVIAQGQTHGEPAVWYPERMPELEIVLNTGMRKSEQYGLNWADVNLVARRVTLRHTKNGSVRHIPLNRVSLQAFQDLWDKSTGEGRVFISTHGADPLQNPRYWWDSVVEEAGLLDFHWHDLLHTFASRCIMAGVDLSTLQQLLGHKTLQMVVRYTHCKRPEFPS
jgi:hypothetical protein